MDQLNALIEGKIDFKGQHLADQISQLLLIVSAIIAFLVGYVTQNIVYTAGIMGIGTLSTLLIVVPPWGFFRRNPVKWLPKLQDTKTK